MMMGIIEPVALYTTETEGGNQTRVKNSFRCKVATIRLGEFRLILLPLLAIAIECTSPHHPISW